MGGEGKPEGKGKGEPRDFSKKLKVQRAALRQRQRGAKGFCKKAKGPKGGLEAKAKGSKGIFQRG